MESLATCFDSLYLTGVMDPQQADEMFHSLGVVVFCSFGVLGAEPLGVNRPQKVGQVKVRIILSCGSGIEPGSFHLNAVLSVCYCSSQCSS